MPLLSRLPNLRDLAQSFFERHYAEDECWKLVRDLLQAGGFGVLAADPAEAVQAVQEVWFYDDPRDPLSLVQPWDWFLCAKVGRPEAGAPVGHIGLVVDNQAFVHVRRVGGVCIEPMRRWRHRLIQVARLRSLVETAA